MDARLIPTRVLGLNEGDAHVIQNAGGVVTDDEIRSLAISQRLLGTEEIILIHHTDCGMLTFTDDEFKRQVQDETGIKPAEAFCDLDEDVRQSIARIKGGEPLHPAQGLDPRIRLPGRNGPPSRGHLSCATLAPGGSPDCSSPMKPTFSAAGFVRLRPSIRCRAVAWRSGPAEAPRVLG
jgi:hypothetical protein